LKSFWLPKGKLRHFFQTEFFGPLQRSLWSHSNRRGAAGVKNYVWKMSANASLLLSASFRNQNMVELVHCLVLSHMFGYVEQKLLSRSRKKFSLLHVNIIFTSVRIFKFRHMFCRNKKFCSVITFVGPYLP
jgi:hypothetical protein